MGCEEVVSKKGRVTYSLNGEFVATQCTKCDQIKNFTEFTKEKLGFCGVRSDCKECRNIINRKGYTDKKEWFKEHNRKHYFGNKDHIQEKSRNRMRKMLEENPEYYRELKRMDFIKYPERNSLAVHRRLARKGSLPDNLTTQQHRAIKENFKECCALTGDSNTHLDHVIPLSIGHGGTVNGNIIPIRADLNVSKGAKNIFEWFDANKERFELSQHKFDELIDYLSEINGMTPKEYRAYVDWCFDNPRDISE